MLDCCYPAQKDMFLRLAIWQKLTVYRSIDMFASLTWRWYCLQPDTKCMYSVKSTNETSVLKQSKHTAISILTVDCCLRQSDFCKKTMNYEFDSTLTNKKEKILCCSADLLTYICKTNKYLTYVNDFSLVTTKWAKPSYKRCFISPNAI